MNKLLIALALMAVGLWSYNAGAINAPKPLEDTRLYDMSEIPCDRIERDTSDDSGQLVCKINLTHEDDNIKIFRGNYQWTK